ncbi:bacteriocin immunity protein [Pseudomonas sp. GD04087]|uniref:bacteriocin immunity protein n=1 Tax=unclassified Pseudomonas TaxID=196821 RepID=UPI00244A42A8|nr:MULTISPECIES: bacteriocin immunity protein [unclassified Pseudomonas]MDH0292506.1 bacteriocin immunity protein [Pseudomonas sp. GD04087]MDH1051143.1 bacteriocin immunity protein [Pseudomonas sp. GD03903]MDH1998473.1 bacteriocin immunity protein [Pseudomonas sp. GD03691]
MFPFTVKNSISEYTEQEFLEIAKEVCAADYGSEQVADQAVVEFVRLAEHPDKSDILFYPPEGSDDSPEGIVKRIKDWRAANGLPGFKKE